MNKKTKRNLRKCIVYGALIGSVALGTYGFYKLFGPAAESLIDVPLPVDIPPEIVLDSGSKLIFAESHSPLQGDMFIVSQYIPV